MTLARNWVRSATIAVSAVAACQFSHGVLPATDDGGDDAPPTDAGPCETLASECVGDTLRVCTAIGSDPNDVPCGWGCLDGPPRCAHVLPSGSGGGATDGVLPSDVAPDGLDDTDLADVTIDGDTGRIGTPQNASLYHGAAIGIENGIDYQRRGPIAMFRFKSLMIGGTITLIGARPIALVADGAVMIDGVIDARGLCSSFVAGPGGFNGGSAAGADGGAPTSTNGGGEGAPASASGGGGGGHASAGGSGDFTNGGLPYGEPTIMTLVGGAGGGAGSGGGNFGRGGGGGGALQIVSNTSIDIGSGGINAGGCGGKPGTGGSDSGGGGGAGGTILLEAPSVTVAGALAANGGGGGGGGGGNAMAGSNGTLDTVTAGGGTGDGNDEQGGTGAATGAEAGSGSNGSNPGGGGGGIGRIRINTRNGGGATLTGATLSPGPSDPEMRFSTGSAATQ